MNANRITHAILFNIKEVEASISMVGDCVALLKKSTTFKDVIKNLDVCYAKYETVAYALIKEYDASEHDKSNRVVVLEELLDSIFDLLEVHKKFFAFENSKEAKKFLYNKRLKIKDLLHSNEFTLSKFVQRYALSMAFGFMALLNIIATFKLLLADRETEDIIGFLILYLAQYVLAIIFTIISVLLIGRERRKGRFIRPTARNKINGYIAIIVSLLIPIVAFFWNRMPL